jgi:dTDP-4-dehydro-6-deoxy-alpha-D-glucopyranose 2,3-dehydratase
MSAGTRLRREDLAPARHLTRAVMEPLPALNTLETFHEWWQGRLRAHRFQVTHIPFADLKGWRFHEETGSLVHHTGRFFSIDGMRVNVAGDESKEWWQPVVNQPETGILGILIKEFDGVPHCLMQAKMEPGNLKTLQLSPTVQATSSNFTRAHKGGAVRYIEYFTGGAPARTVVDTLQSEQGAWCFRKHNRNMIVQVGDEDEVEVHEDFIWLTLQQVHALLGFDNLVNMCSRTVLSCLPYTAPGGAVAQGAGDGFRDAFARSLDPDEGAVHTVGEILSWFTGAKTRNHTRTRWVTLSEVKGWQHGDKEISRDDGRNFAVIAVDVAAETREVPGWTQPILAPRANSLSALIVKRIDGVLHLLMQARPEAGLLDALEMAPTVQCDPADDPGDSPGGIRFLDEVLSAPGERVLFDTNLSEEGGRFYHAQTRYLIVEAAEDFPVEEPEDHRWLTLHQVSRLLRHNQYLTVQARSLVACLNSLW